MTPRRVSTLAIRRAHERADPERAAAWWSPEASRWFRSTYSGGYVDAAGRCYYLVHGTCYREGTARHYCVVRFDSRTGDVETLGTLFTHATRARALGAARRLAEGGPPVTHRVDAQPFCRGASGARLLTRCVDASPSTPAGPPSRPGEPAHRRGL